MARMTRLAFLTMLSLAMVGCLRDPGLKAETAERMINKGMTRADVIAVLGKPQGVNRRPVEADARRDDNDAVRGTNEVHTYDFPDQGQLLVVTYGPKGVVTDIKRLQTPAP